VATVFELQPQSPAAAKLKSGIVGCAVAPGRYIELWDAPPRPTEIVEDINIPKIIEIRFKEMRLYLVMKVKIIYSLYRDAMISS
jgi:hypothetical protein